MSARPADPIRAGLARGWRVVDVAAPGDDVRIECDVAIVGSGAGGGMCAEILAQAGLSVAIVEEGPLRSSSDFRMREPEAYRDLYQEGAARRTADRAIGILQGRCVGGSTTVNWTTSFRAPAVTLDHWVRAHGLADCAPAALAPWFERVESRLGIAPWTVAPNANNAALLRGAQALRLSAGGMQRNVRGCAGLGYCGLGCPLDAKQSMLVTTLPSALDRGATLLVRARAERLVLARDRVTALEGRGVDASGAAPGMRRFTVRARMYVAAAGAIGTPALLMRSDVPDPHGLAGKRTFLHPVVVSVAVMPARVDAFAGAPQSAYSDHYQDGAALDGPMGFKLEAAPAYPILIAMSLPGHGREHAQRMRDLAHMQVTIALLRDGFHRDSPGGSVRLRDDGTPVLDYPLTRYVWDGARRAFAAMADVQFAAGAKHVTPVHGAGTAFTTPAAARTAIAGFALAPLATPLMSAHAMGGCPMGPDARSAVVTPQGRHHHVENLHVADASLFPTSVGANPQVSVYAFAARVAEGLARAMRRGD